jgi:hypothetical protein
MTGSADVEPMGLMQDFGQDFCFYGGVGPKETLCKGAPRQMASEVMHLVGVLNRDGATF